MLVEELLQIQQLSTTVVTVQRLFSSPNIQKLANRLPKQIKTHILVYEECVSPFYRHAHARSKGYYIMHVIYPQAKKSNVDFTSQSFHYLSTSLLHILTVNWAILCYPSQGKKNHRTAISKLFVSRIITAAKTAKTASNLQKIDAHSRNRTGLSWIGSFLLFFWLGLLKQRPCMY